jgi:hypothetical protein
MLEEIRYNNGKLARINRKQAKVMVLLFLAMLGVSVTNLIGMVLDLRAGESYWYNGLAALVWFLAALGALHTRRMHINLALDLERDP